MKKRRHIKLSTALFKGGYIYNPVLTQLSGICPIVAAASTTANAFYITLVFGVILIFNEVITALFLKKVPRYIRVAVYPIISSVALIVCFSVLGEQSISSIGIYLLLLSVNAVIVIRCERFAARASVVSSLFDAVAGAVGFGAAAIAVGFIRQLINQSSAFSQSGTSGAAMPFMGFLVLGFLAAAHKMSVKKLFPEELSDVFSMKKAFDRPVFTEPGLRLGRAEKRSSRSFGAQEDYSYQPKYSILDLDDNENSDESAEKEEQ